MGFHADDDELINPLNPFARAFPSRVSGSWSGGRSVALGNIYPSKVKQSLNFLNFFGEVGKKCLHLISRQFVSLTAPIGRRSRRASLLHDQLVPKSGPHFSWLIT